MVAVRRFPFIVLRPRRRAPRTLAVALPRSIADLGPTFGQLVASSPGLFAVVAADEFRYRDDKEASWVRCDRFLATEVWERFGIGPSDGLLYASRSPMMETFQHVPFAKIAPNLTKVGLLVEKLRDRLVAIGAIPTS